MKKTNIKDHLTPAEREEQFVRDRAAVRGVSVEEYKRQTAEAQQAREDKKAAIK